jgi:hypothetical protein
VKKTTSTALLDHLHTAPGWRHQISVGLNTASPMAIFRRIDGPLAGYTLNVPMHDADPGWCADTAAIINDVERGRTPLAGVLGDVIVRAIDAIGAICGSDRTGPATVGEIVALQGVLDPWYTADADDRQVLRAICNGRALEQVSERSMRALGHLTTHLTALLLAAVSRPL